MMSTGALEMADIPAKNVSYSGGGLSVGNGYSLSALGSKIWVVEFLDQLVPAADKDVARFIRKYVKEKINVMLETKKLPRRS